MRPVTRAAEGARAWFLRHFGAKEVILVVGFGLLFSGLARATLTGALVICGALLVRLAWPTTPLQLESPRQPRHDSPAVQRRG